MTHELPTPAARLQSVLPGVAAAFAAAIFAIDSFTRLDIAIAVLYVAVVLMSVRFCERRGILWISAGCVALTLVAFALSHDPNEGAALARCIVSICAIVITAFLSLRIQATTSALREQARLLDLTHDTIFVRDMTEIITYWNRGAEELYGWPRDEAIGRVSHELLQTAFPLSAAAIRGELLRAGRWEGELVQTKRDGTRVTASSRWSLQRGERGVPVAILETNTDITERKRAEEALHQAQAELAHATRVTTLGQLTASIAHEVNQPLAAIVTNGEASLRWLAGDPPNLDEARAALKRIINDGIRASEVVRRIRGLSMKAAPEMGRLDINDIIHETVPLVRRAALTQRVAIRLDLAPALPIVFGDRVQLQQVLLNLVMNGVEAILPDAPSPREVLIRSQMDESGQVHIAVQDFGVGIEGDADRLFNAFFTTKREGLGMGLSICRSIVQAHGGHVWATNNAGPGATVQFTLPPAGADALQLE